MSEGEKATSGSGDVEASELRGSGLVNHLKSRWEAAYAGDRAALLASGEELPPLSQLPAAARAFGGPGAGPAARGMAAARTPGASPQLLEAVLREDDPEERVEAWEVQERRPGGGLLAEGGDAEAAQDPRRTSLVQYVRATLKNRGEMHLVFKTPKPSPEVAKVLDIEAMTAKEIGMYQHVLPNMASLWPEQAFDVFPRCIHSSNDALILEDLREAGFAEAEHPEAGLDVEQCAAVLAALARFHAASLAYKCAGVAEAGEVLAQAGHETVYTAQRREKIEPLLTAAARNTLELLKRHPQASKHAAKVKALLSDRFGRLEELHRAREPWAVLTHGDPRARNAVFRRRPRRRRAAPRGSPARPARVPLRLPGARPGAPAVRGRGRAGRPRRAGRAAQGLLPGAVARAQDGARRPAAALLPGAAAQGGGRLRRVRAADGRPVAAPATQRGDHTRAGRGRRGRRGRGRRRWRRGGGCGRGGVHHFQRPRRRLRPRLRGPRARAGRPGPAQVGRLERACSSGPAQEGRFERACSRAPAQDGRLERVCSSAPAQEGRLERVCSRAPAQVGRLVQACTSRPA